jgi:hypothetical protein
MLRWLTENQKKILAVVGGVGAIVPLLSLALSAYQFVRIEDQKLKQQRFENYHALIAKFGTRAISSTVTVTTMYELKNYPEYCEVSLLIVEFYQEYWTDKLSKDGLLLVRPHLEQQCRDPQPSVSK